MIPWRDTKSIKVLLIVVIGGFVIGGTIMILSLKYWWSKYPEIQKSDIVNNIVTEVNAYQSVAMVKLDDGRQLTLNGSGNYNYRPYYLKDFLQQGDSLIKQRGSDTLKIIRTSNHYVFVLDELINTEK